MNIFKKISIAGKIIKAIDELKKFFKNNDVSKEITEAVQDVIKAVEKLIKLLPALKDALDSVIAIIKGALKK